MIRFVEMKRYLTQAQQVTIISWLAEWCRLCNLCPEQRIEACPRRGEE
jgi:hypothetical protein